MDEILKNGKIGDLFGDSISKALEWSFFFYILLEIAIFFFLIRLLSKIDFFFLY